MIISRAPFRVSFCGGGSDIPSFYEKYGGCVVSCAIKKYVYIALHPSFDKEGITLKYSKTEEVFDYKDIEHKYFKVVLQDYNVKGVEIASMADIPSGTGLGSSSAFTVALLLALKTYLHKKYSKDMLANEACDVEIVKAGCPIGKQDQYASAFGGINFITFNKNGKVDVEPLIIPSNGIEKLQKNLMLFYTGLKHDANSILDKQQKNLNNDEKKILSQRTLCEMTKSLKKHLEDGDIDYLGECLNKSWEIKKTLTNGISNSKIDQIYQLAIHSGAIGGKLLGAGAGGFMLFYVKPERQNDVRHALSNYQELNFEIDNEGASVVFGSK